jgi:hypothetical protein
MGKRWAFLVLALLALLPISGAAAPAWEQWQAVHGVFDLGGPRADGSLVVAGSAALYIVTADGVLSPFARGPGGYRDDPGTEAYLAVSPGQHVASAGCDFARDDVFILRLHTPIGITRVQSSGQESGSFVNVAVPSLNGIAFDSVGLFDHRLLATGPINGKTEVVAIDCGGAVQVITKTAPTSEGGLAVAPQTFGGFGGDLIVPDELSGIIWAIGPDGTAKQLVNTGLARGQDTGVESLGFVPPGFSKGGYIYYADRATAGSAHAGTDNVLRLSSADLVPAGVQDGDLLGATEGGATMVDVRCDSSCNATRVLSTPTVAHGEGHLAFTITPLQTPSSSPIVEPPERANTVPLGSYVAIAAAMVAALAAALLAVAASRRRR